MEKFLRIIEYALGNNASDIHLVEGLPPIYRIKRQIFRNKDIEIMTRYDLEGLLEALLEDSLELVEQFEKDKKIDISFETEKGVRLRINASLANKVPVFSIRVIKNIEIDIENFNLKAPLELLRKYTSGLILITGKVNSGKSTTLNAFVQEMNKVDNKKIIMLEEPIEHIHKSMRSVIVQKEVGKNSDVPSFYNGVINLFREDADVIVVGEIRDRETMNAVIDLAESGALVIGTLHTRSCGETIDRIINFYDAIEQRSIKCSLSSVLKAVVSQKLVMNKKDDIIMVSEMMVNNTKIASLIRQENFNISEMQDAIHVGKGDGMISFEQAFAILVKKDVLDISTLPKYLSEEEIKLVSDILGGNN